MRLLALLALLATPAHADTIEAPGPVTAVTLYPAGATVTRTVTFTAPAGTHEIIVPGVSAAMFAEGLRVTAPEGVEVGAVSLAEMRPPSKGGFKSTAVLAAEAEVARLEAVLRDKRGEVAGIRAHAEAAEARVAFLQSLAKSKGEGNLTAAAIPDLRALAKMIDEEVLAARQTVLAVEKQATVAEIALQPDVVALERANEVLVAMVAPQDGPPIALTVNLQTAKEGEVTLTVDAFMQGAGWAPVYDLRLTRKPDVLAMARSVMVRQETGEDWLGVPLTLSTANPDGQMRTSLVRPDRRWIKSKEDIEREAKAAAEEAAREGLVEGEMGGLTEPVMEAVVYVFDTSRLGQVFTYQFSAPVTIHSGTDALRLAMDDVSPKVEIFAGAAPLRDETAFLMADLTNTTGQPLLPGKALLYADGALVGATDLEGVPPGGHAEIGFGPIPGLRLTRIEPHRTAGQEGVFTSSNRQEETAIITVENLTDEAWPLRVTDRIPYSEQDDLAVTWTATPPATTVDPEGRRGVLVWTFDLAAGAKQDIRIDARMDWPDGWVLQ